MKALLVALMCMVPFKPNIELIDTVTEVKYIEENDLEYVYLSCYLPTGYNCADGTPPYEGVVSSNREHLGMDCIVYNKDLVAVMRLECRDIGGDPRLVNGTAIDVFRSSYDRCLQLREELTDHVYIKWIDRSEGKDGEISSDSVECRYETRLQERKRVNDKREARPDIR